MVKTFTRQYLKLPLWLWLLLGVIVLLRIPSLFEPFSYGDELIYLTLGEGIRKGLVLYRDIFDHKTPLLYYLAAIAGNVFWFRFILGVWMLITTVLYYKLIQLLFPKNGHIRFFSLLTFVILTTIPLWEGQISNAELFMMLPVIGGILLISQLIQKIGIAESLSSAAIFLSGVAFSIATLFKVPAMFEAGIVVFIAFVVFTTQGFQFRKLIKFLLLWGMGFLIPIVLSGVWFWLRGAWNDYLYGGLLINVGYISAFRPDDVQEPFLTRNAPLLIRGLILLICLAGLYIYRNKLSKSFLFLSAWLFFSLFAATLSERPYPHYLIQIAPAFAGLIGLLLAGRTKEQVFTIVPLSLAVFAMSYFHFWYYHTAPYYQRFTEYASGQINKLEYYDRFDGGVNRNYQIAQYIQNHTNHNDPIFVWGDSSNIYAISRRLPPLRYLTSFHINDFYSQEKAIQDLSNTKPRIVVILPDSPSFPGLKVFLDTNSYYFAEEIDGAEIWQVQ
jgi:hypothetical protein